MLFDFFIPLAALLALTACARWAVEQLRPRMDLVAEVRTLVERQEALERRWDLAKLDYEALAERAESLLDSAERKRRSTASSLAKMEGKNGAATGETRQQELRRLARERGIAV